ncbi:MAG: hypothetical protein K0S08_1763 [Gammaproteobacteria bacterium]|jgi:hypothetical protein|nr:hypothetical protein [Gammaproteobacteria bacterium]
MDLTLNAILHGFSLGIVSYLLPLLLSWVLLVRQHFLSGKIFVWILLAAIFHFIAGFCYWLMSVFFSSDSNMYFFMGNGVFRGIGTRFCTFMMYFLRQWFLGDSLLGGFLFSSALGFLGQFFFFLAFINLAKKISPAVQSDFKLIRLPALVILFWPSAIFWSSGIAKDSVAFFALGLFFLALTFININFIKSSLVIVFALICAYFVRPYLLMIILLALGLWVLIGAKIKVSKKSLLALIVMCGVALIAPQIALTGHFHYTYADVTRFILASLAGGNQGTSLGLGKVTLQQTVFLLPFLMLANAYFPLFIYAKNILGVISSFENLIFLWISVYCICNRDVFKELVRKNPLILFCVCFFLIGIFFLALLNTNFGLSMRRKIMYTIPFIMVWAVIYVQKKITSLQRVNAL